MCVCVLQVWVVAHARVQPTKAHMYIWLCDMCKIHDKKWQHLDVMISVVHIIHFPEIVKHTEVG